MKKVNEYFTPTANLRGGGGHTSAFAPTFDYKVIYAYTRPNAPEVKNQVKIGETTLYVSDITRYKQNGDALELGRENPNVLQELLNEAAHRRIKAQLGTGAVSYKLELAELAITDEGEKQGQAFRDYSVHDVLERSGFKKSQLKNDAREWFKCTVDDVKRAIKCVKIGRQSFGIEEIKFDDAIIFRKEQNAFIKKANRWFKNGTLEKPKEYLGNLKMRFGKTLSALKIAHKNEDISKVLIITHRPVVNDGWFEDFHKIFDEQSGWKYGSKKKGEKFENLVKNYNHWIYFASIQDLRKSWDVNGKFTKNQDIFDTEFDMVVIDEAHEGTQTELATNMEQNLKTRYKLHLSGTPFNLVEQFNEDNTSTWDYVNEQAEKRKWDEEKPEISNPYEELPEARMFTYHLWEALRINPTLKDKSFTFKDFFQVDFDQTNSFQKTLSNGKIETYWYHPFVRHSDVIDFLNKISNTEHSDKAQYFPFSTVAFASFLKHTLWLLPGVEACKTLEAVLAEHVHFSRYKVVNASGEGTYENEDAIDAVRDAIGENSDESETITLTCGQLTTGVTVPEWTGVLMLSNISSPSLYLQTAFRAQSPANYGGKIKTHCYIFDFAPDRALSMAVAANQISKKPGDANDEIKREELKIFLEYCPIIAADGAKLEPYNVDRLMQTLKEIYIEKTVEKGFDTPILYNQYALRKLSELDVELFNTLQTKVGSQQNKATKEKVQIVKHDLEGGKLSAEHLVVQGREIIRKARNGEYKRFVPDIILSQGETAIDKLERAVQDVDQFIMEHDMKNHARFSKKTKDKRDALEHELDNSRDSARSIIERIIKIANAKDKLPPDPEKAQRKKEREQARKAQAILRAVAVRVPLLVFGREKYDKTHEATKEITVTNFPELIDDKSWEEFMPKGFEKVSRPPMGDENLIVPTEDENGNLVKIVPGWDYAMRFFDKDIFEGSCKYIQDRVEAMDELSPLERVVELANLFNTFKNPDKETVLTPWRVVNMHLSDVLGGLRWVDSESPHGKWFTNQIDENGEPFNMSRLEIASIPDTEVQPKWKDNDVWQNHDIRFLDMNSKTCLYPLYIAASLYIERILESKMQEGDTIQDWIEIIRGDLVREPDWDTWKEIIEQNIFVNVRVEYSASIARRVLCGYHDIDKHQIKPNISVVDLVEINREKKKDKTKELTDEFRTRMCEQFNAHEKEGEEMKFDVVVGNPPYNDPLSGNKMSKNVYQDFVIEAAKISTTQVLIIKAGWLGGELGPYRELTGFTEFMKELGIKEFHDFPNSKDVFTDNDISIKGGVCYFVAEENYNDKISYFLHEGDKKHKWTRTFDNPVRDDVIIRFRELDSVVKKINFTESVGSMTKLVSSWNPFGFISDLFYKENELVNPTDEKTADDDYLIHGLLKNGKRAIKYIRNADLIKNIEGAKSWKVFVPRANGSGAFGEVFSSPMLGSPMLGSPMQICTDTFLEIGRFNTETEAQAVLNYVKTKFFRAMVGVKKIAVFNYKDAFSFVPIQDFTQNSDIDWSKSIFEIDKQFYAKYKLAKSEIEFIENRVKDMI